MESKHKLSVFMLILSAYPAIKIISIISDADVPELPEVYWGRPDSNNGQVEESTRISLFEIKIDEKVITDLKTRLKLEPSSQGNRLKSSPRDDGVGFNINHLQRVTQYWLNKYDWRKQEKALNKYPHYKTKISGLDIHFQRIQSVNQERYNKTRPLLLIHGWPSSFTEFQKLIPLLIEPAGSNINFEVSSQFNCVTI